MVKYKLSRIRQLANPRYASWMFLSRFRSECPLRTRLRDELFIEYLPRGNVSRDLYLGQFEEDVTDFFVHYLRPGMVVIDVGANIGVYSLLSAKYVGERGAVHAFEPTPDTFAQLCTNAALNRLSCIRTNRLAVSDKSGTSSLYLYNQNAMNSLAMQDWVGSAVGQVQVDTVSLDEYVRAAELGRVDLLKVDAEGAELRVLQGAVELLERPKSPVVVCEFADKTTRNFGYEAAAIREYLENLGYRLFRWSRRSATLLPEPARADYELYANLICTKGEAER